MFIELSWTVVCEIVLAGLVAETVEREKRAYERAVARWEKRQADLAVEDARREAAERARPRDPRGSKAGVKRGPYRKGRLLIKEGRDL